MPTDELILVRDASDQAPPGLPARSAGEVDDGWRDWIDSTLARGAMFDPGTDAVQITEEEARAMHPKLVLPIA